MAAIFIDRRKNDKGKNLGNKQRFLRRVKETIRSNTHKLISDKIGKEKEEDKVKVDKNTIEEPTFVYSRSNTMDIVFIGNTKYVKGDKFDMKDLEQEGQGGGKQAGSGEGEDDFSINISREEFLNYFFEDLELPNLDKKFDSEIKSEKFHNAGFTTDGPPSRLSIIRTIIRSKMRRKALQAPFKKKIKELEKELENETDEEKIALLLKQISALNIKSRAVSFIEPSVDLRYRASAPTMNKQASAVIFFVMDNSGSMGEREKTFGRKYFTLFYLFVQRKYEDVKLVFITHTDTAKEVDEETFFTTKESGGTAVSTALTLVNKIIDERFDYNRTNIYISQVSDGDNMSNDNAKCEKAMTDLFPKIQHHSYIQVDPEDRGHSLNTSKDLWEAYEEIADLPAAKGKFAMEGISDVEEIYTVFKNIFGKKNG